MLLAALTLLAPVAQADCAAGAISVSPAPQSELRVGQQLVIDAYGTDRQRIADLDRGDVVLVSRGDRIELRVVEHLKGGFHRDMVVLEPARAPAADRRWTLELHGEPFTQWYEGADQTATWAVTDAPVGGPPAWASTPTVVDKNRTEFGCGPSVHVNVEVAVKDAAWIEATVWPISGGEPRTTMRLQVRDGQVAIGHGMCSGEFSLRGGDEYLAELVAIDALGRRSAADDSPLRFTAP